MGETYYDIPLTNHALPAFCAGPKGCCGAGASQPVPTAFCNDIFGDG